MRRPEVALAHPELPNKEVSRLLGKEWHAMSSDDRQTFLDLAEQEKHEHALQYPNYRFHPASKKAPKSAGYYAMRKELETNGLQALLDSFNFCAFLPQET